MREIAIYLTDGFKEYKIDDFTKVFLYSLKKSRDQIIPPIKKATEGVVLELLRKKIAFHLRKADDGFIKYLEEKKYPLKLDRAGGV